MFLQIAGNGVNVVPRQPGRPTSTSKTLTESTNRDLPFITTENATTELDGNGTFQENQFSTSATKIGPNNDIFVLTVVITLIILVVYVGTRSGVRLCVSKSKTKEEQNASDEETPLQVIHVSIYNKIQKKLKFYNISKIWLIMYIYTRRIYSSNQSCSTLVFARLVDVGIFD